jgi:enoyl-[acyl-carrier-protein] reductase (NADH)
MLNRAKRNNMCKVDADSSDDIKMTLSSVVKWLIKLKTVSHFTFYYDRTELNNEDFIQRKITKNMKNSMRMVYYTTTKTNFDEDR